MLQGLKNKAIRFLLERTCPDVFTIKAMLSKVTRKEMINSTQRKRVKYENKNCIYLFPLSRCCFHGA